MDERENVQTNAQTEASINAQMNAQTIQQDSDNNKAFIHIAAIVFAILALGSIGFLIYVAFSPKPMPGYRNYVIHKEQYYMEYSEHFDYWDVVTIEYPELEGIDEELQEQINTSMYDVAMDRARYWHLRPDTEVAAFQKEYFSLFCSDVNCDVNYHSQFLASVHYCEFYSPGDPVYGTKYTERAINVDLLTGEIYELSDVFNIDEEFIKLWIQSMNEEHGQAFLADSDDAVEILLSWFHKEDEELNQFYEFRPYFYLTEDKGFVIGISLDPLPAGITSSAPENSTYCTCIETEKLEPYRTDSAFWEKYDKSEMAGEVLPCKNKKENLWLGEEASIWSYWDER